MAALKQHRLYIAHAHTKAHNADAIQLAQFLDRAPRFAWTDLAKHDATASENARKQAAREDITKAQCLLLPVGVYLADKAWARFQLDCAKEADIPVVAVKPADGKVTPLEIQTTAKEVVPWNPKDLAKAIKNAIKDAQDNHTRSVVTQSHAPNPEPAKPKTAAQRQAESRARRHKAGINGDGQRQLNTWLDTGVALALERIARRDAVTKREILEKLIRQEDARILEQMDSSTKEWDEYFGVKTVTESH